MSIDPEYSWYEIGVEILAILYMLTLPIRALSLRFREPNSTTALARRMWRDAFIEEPPRYLHAIIVPAWVFAAMRNDKEVAFGIVILGKAMTTLDLVLINEDIKTYGPATILFTLLHELCHFKASDGPDGHGPLFKATYDAAIARFDWRHGYHFSAYRNASA